MANLQQCPPSSDAHPSGGSASADNDCVMHSAEQLVLHLRNPDLREIALLELAKKRELIKDFGPLLWYSSGTVSALLQEIVSIYQFLSPPNLSNAQSTRVCNALALLQCVASHPKTRMLFIQAHMPVYLYPFFKLTRIDKPYEFLRLTSLGVVGALVKLDETEVINYLLSTDIFIPCLHAMEVGSELSKTVATFIMHKILLDDTGLYYVFNSIEKFYALTRVLAINVAVLANHPSPQLLKHIIRCYLRLSENPRVCDALGSCLPNLLTNGTFNGYCRDDLIVIRWLQRLIENVYSRAPIQR